jgi:hypothetical protein
VTFLVKEFFLLSAATSFTTLAAAALLDAPFAFRVAAIFSILRRLAASD